MRRSGKGRILDPRSFVVYYGYGPLAGIEGFDLALLAPTGWSAGDLAALKGFGVTAIAYLSVLEATDAAYRQAGLGPDDLLRVEGRPWRRQEFGTWVVHPRSERWRSHLARSAGALMAAGWDGLFLDTVGDVEDAALQGEVGWLLPAVAELVHHVRLAAPSAWIVQNNGVWLLLPLVVNDIDGVCWETSVEMAASGPFAEAALRSLTLAKNRYRIAPLLLGSVDSGPDEGPATRVLHDLARRFGFRCYIAPGTYTAAVRLPDGRILPGH